MKYKHKLILFCKSYRADVHRVKILFDSIQRHNLDQLPFYISIPKDDLSIFQNELGNDGYEIVVDEDLTTLTSQQSHFTQQLFKMEFYKTNIAEFFFLIDSDMYFIKDFTTIDLPIYIYQKFLRVYMKNIVSRII